MKKRSVTIWTLGKDIQLKCLCTVGKDVKQCKTVDAVGKICINWNIYLPSYVESIQPLVIYPKETKNCYELNVYRFKIYV